MAPRFRSNAWDPILIVAQMVTLQCLFYLSSGLLMLAFYTPLGYTATLRCLFSPDDLRFREPTGKILVSAFLLTSLVCAFGLWRIVKRSKQCLDFTCTVHFWHFVACLSYAKSIPISPTWWLTNILSILFMTLLSEFLCMRAEMRAIPINQSRSL
ncbi:unnamed protein product [Protopolystoma xenopodis]|uniref:Protein SYS1 homolog n=1 Tax=Protopolystoma xenopodis TaxID=117903 RepID=A0A3S5CJR8_9PLAT|nr:unnamed protein product [Protopolystoma xenopodis]